MSERIFDLSDDISQAISAAAPPAARPAASAAAPASGEPGMFDGVLSEAGKVASRFGDSAQYGGYRVLEDYATSADELGIPALAEALRSYRPEIAADFQPAGSAFVNSGGEGYSWGHLPRAIVEQGAQLGVGLAARGVGAAAGGLVAGPGGAAAGAIGLPAVAGMAQSLGTTVQDRARENGRTEPNQEDWAYALAIAGGSGLLDSFGLKGLTGRGAGGVIRRTGKELATETGQSVLQQAGTTVGTPGGMRVDISDAVGEGIIGAGAGAPVAVVGRARDEGNPTPAVAQTPDDIRLAERLSRNATESEFNLGSRDRSDTEGAFGAVASVRNEVRSEAREASAALTQLANRRDDTKGANLVRRVMSKSFADSQSVASSSDLAKLREHFGDLKEVQDLISLAGQRRRLNQFLKPGGTIGGLSQYTRMLDPMESKSGAFQKGVGLLSLTAGAGIPGLLVNRAAVGIDKATGRYSPVKRFVDSARGRETDADHSDLITARDFDSRTPFDSDDPRNDPRDASEAAYAKLHPEYDPNGGKTSGWFGRGGHDPKAVAAQARADAARANARSAAARAQTAEAGVPGAQARSAAAASNAQGAASRASVARDRAGSSPELEARKVAAAALREKILAHNAQTAQARMTVAQAKADRAALMEEARLARDLEVVKQLQKANEAEAQRELDARNASAADRAKAAAEAAKPQPIPDLNDADKRQIKAVKKVSEYWDGDEAATEAAIEGEFQAMLQGRTARHGYDLNMAQKKASKGNAASRAISLLADRLNDRTDIPYSKKSKYLDALNAMNHPEETRTNRKALLERMETDLAPVLDTDPDAQLALSIARALRDAGSAGSNEGRNSYSGPGRGFKALPKAKASGKPAK